MRVLFLNQYFPPDPAPTGVLLAEVADALEQRGHTVDFVAARQEYRAGQKQGGRLIREARALWRMLIDGLRRPRPEVVVSATSPPCLLVVATLVAGWHRARSVHWVMDVYPEIAVALGELRAGIVSRMLGALMGWCYRRATPVVVLDEDMAARLRIHGVEPAIIRPWVFAKVLPQLDGIRGEPQPQWTWIYSGNLGRAHEWETLLQAQAEVERRGAAIHLLFQGGGPSRPAAEARARELGLRLVEWRDYVPEEELPASLLRCHALAVTQLPAAQGLLWPSKLGLAMSLPRPLIWIGPTDSAIAKMLRALGHTGIFAPGESAKLADWLVAHSTSATPAPSATIFNAAKHRAESLAALTALIEST